uniref:Uncharacterized protein n=1 Tax=Rhizophora mucronata TaxID=61149 RepID=A0A2P2PMU4_RHIMU
MSRPIATYHTKRNATRVLIVLVCNLSDNMREMHISVHQKAFGHNISNLPLSHPFIEYKGKKKSKNWKILYKTKIRKWKTQKKEDNKEPHKKKEMDR